MENVYMLKTRRHYILSAPRGFQMENRFFLGLFPEFFGFKKFLTKTLFPVGDGQASRCLDYDKAYRRFNSLFLN